MSLTNRIKQVIPGTIDDRIIDEAVEATQSVRDGATDAGVTAGNILDESLTKLTEAIPGHVDDDMYQKLKDMLRGDNHQN